MKLTPEQKAQLDADRERGYRRSRIALTPEQAAEIRREQELESAHRDEHLREIHRLDELLEEDSFLGSIRRALNESDKSWDVHARDSGVPAEQIERFFPASWTCP